MITDQQLIAELAKSGRPLTVVLLRDWRAAGLLPPLATSGKRRAGRAFFWTTPDIILRAQYVHDAMLEFRDPRRAVWLLWIAGFDVPITNVKRIWLYRLKHKPSWIARQTEPELFRRALRNDRRPKPPKVAGEMDVSASILNIVMSLAEPLVLRDTWIDWKVFFATLDGIAREIGFVRSGIDEWTAARLVTLISVVFSVAESSNLTASATADEFTTARDAAAIVSRLIAKGETSNQGLGATASVPPFWSPSLGANVATPLVFAILLFLRSGRARQVQRTVREFSALVGSEPEMRLAALPRFRTRLAAIWRELDSFG